MSGPAAPPRRTRSTEWWRRLPVPVRRAVIGARHLSHPGHRPRPKLSTEVIGDVVVIGFDDGKVNAISRRMTAAFAEALDRAAADERIRAVVMTGRPGQFSAGFDLDTLMIGGREREELIRGGWGLMLRLLTLPLPVVVACSGNAVAAGAALLLTADARIAAAGDFKIGFNEVAIGFPLPGAVLALIRDRIEPAAFDDATAGARMYGPDEALRAGFVDRVVPPEELRGAAIAQAAALAQRPAFALEKERGAGALAARMRERLPADLELIERIGV